MPSRADDWLRQALRDLAHARNTFDDGVYEWAAFAAQQASEKAVKAPGDFYTAVEAQRAIAAAERVVEHCQRHLVR
jgi:HEPN domain-containing protein